MRRRGSEWNPNPPFNGDYGMWPNQIESYLPGHFNTFCQNSPCFVLWQMTTHSLSSPLNHFECPALPVAIAQPQAPRNFFSKIWHKPSFPLFLPSIILEIYPSLECILRFGSVPQIKILQCYPITWRIWMSANWSFLLVGQYVLNSKIDLDFRVPAVVAHFRGQRKGAGLAQIETSLVHSVGLPNKF